jgi:hypothetical protein
VEELNKIGYEIVKKNKCCEKTIIIEKINCCGYLVKEDDRMKAYEGREAVESFLKNIIITMT